jgi:hypothetical protein
MKSISQVLFFTLLLISSCEKDSTQNPNIKVDHDLVLELYDKARDTILIDAYNYFLEAFLWRDFQPISPPNGQPLISINWLVRADSNAIPSNIKLKLQYVINGDSVWIADYMNDTRSSPEYKQEKISMNGPKWGPNIYVNIIAKITDTIENRDFYLKRSNVLIGRTD